MSTAPNPNDVNADEPTPYVPTTAVEGERVATATLRGVPIRVPDPSWCVTDHSAEDENLAFIEDLSHQGAPISLPVTQFSGAVERVLVAKLCQWPYEREHGAKGLPFLAVDADGSGECNQYAADAALAFADQLVAHAEAIREQARVLQGGER